MRRCRTLKKVVKISNASDGSGPAQRKEHACSVVDLQSQTRLGLECHLIRCCVVSLCISFLLIDPAFCMIFDGENCRMQCNTLVTFSLPLQVVMPLAPKSPVAVVSKVCIDQMLNSPLGTASFFIWTQAMQGRPENAIPEIADKLWPTTQVAWRLWPIAQAVNFVMVPTHLRVIFINAVAILWTTILSGIGN
jgi:hypothetical protein